MSPIRSLQRLWTSAFVVLTIGIVYDSGATPAAVHVSIVSEFSHVGDNITLQCRVVGVSDLHPRVRWVKSAVSDSAEQTVADGEQVVEPYFRLGRYFASLTPLSQVTLYTLTIYWVRHEDSGRIRCVLPDVYHYNSDADSIVLKVFKRPSRLYFVGHEAASELTLTENEPRSLECEALRVLPLPHLEIRVRNRSVSEHLTPNATVNVHCRDPACGPVHYDLDARLTIPLLLVRHADDGHYVTCNARLPHSNWTPNQTALRLNVRYRPRFRCRGSHGAELHASNVSIVCVLHHNPDPSELYVTWHRGGPPRIDVGNSYGGNYRLSKSTAGQKETRLTFVIDRVTQHDFHNYHFHASNDVGRTSHGVKLIRRHPPPHGFTGSAMSSRRMTSPDPRSSHPSAAVSFMMSTTSPLCICFIILHGCIVNS